MPRGLSSKLLLEASIKNASDSIVKAPYKEQRKVSCFSYFSS